MKLSFSTILLTVIVLSACVTEPKEPNTVRKVDMNIELITESGDYDKAMLDYEEYESLNQSKEAAVATQCGLEASEDELAPAALTFLVGPIIDWIVGSIKQSIENELKKYTAVYKTQKSGYTYQQFLDGTPKLQIKCIRFSRSVSRGNGDRVVVDLVSELKLAESRDALLIRPLRLYFSEAVAKGDQFNIGFSLKANSVFLDDRVGRSSDIFDHTFLVEKKITLVDSNSNPKAFVKYYDLDQKSWNKSKRLPLPAWSSNADLDQKFGLTTFTVSVAESGVPPDFYTAAAKYLKKYEEDISDLIKKTISGD